MPETPIVDNAGTERNHADYDDCNSTASALIVAALISPMSLGTHIRSSKKEAKAPTQPTMSSPTISLADDAPDPPLARSNPASASNVESISDSVCGRPLSFQGDFEARFNVSPMMASRLRQRIEDTSAYGLDARYGLVEAYWFHRS